MKYGLSAVLVAAASSSSSLMACGFDVAAECAACEGHPPLLPGAIGGSPSGARLRDSAGAASRHPRAIHTRQP